MRVRVNGDVLDLDRPVTVGELVDGSVTDRRGVAVAVDGEIVPRSRWDDVTITEGAHIEIVGAVQGG